MSVILSADIRWQLEREAKKRGLGLSPALRTLVVERLRELEDSAQLSRAALWQRAQAWASWERAERGENPEITWTEVDAAFERDAARRRRP